ncbi:MAG: flagellar export chaperone FlgN [Armatimonadota bacterium]|nr:flagellar protein FlgN [bacterium]
MGSREELSEALVECLKEVGSLIEYANSITLRQRAGLVANDAEEIAVTSRAHEEILRRVSQADQRAAAIATELAQLVGVDPENSDPNALAKAAGFPFSIMIKTEMEHVASLSEKLRRASKVNRRLLDNGLEILTSCLRIIADDPGPSSYSKDANMIPNGSHVLSLDMRV